MKATNRELKTIELDGRGMDFVIDHLEDVNKLCAALLKAIRSTSGRVFTIAPAEVSFEQAHDFASGGILAENLDFTRAKRNPSGTTMMPVTTLREDQSRRILDLLARRPGRVCIVDDFNPRWGDPRESDYGPNAFGIGEEVYHWIDAEFGVEPLERLLRMTGCIWHGVAAVCEGAAPASPPTIEWMTSSAEQVVEVQCTAYDGEGFVVWRRASD
ncbi:MAG: hypothetical protein ACRED8_06485 [Caulobacteraceae bacterium]